MLRKKVLLQVVMCGLAAGLFTAASIAQAQSPADCDAYARNNANRYGSGIMGGAVRGAAGGALFGAIIGGGKGAGKGAALGGLVGGVRQGAVQKNARQRAYDACMAGQVRW